VLDKTRSPTIVQGISNILAHLPGSMFETKPPKLLVTFGCPTNSTKDCRAYAVNALWMLAVPPSLNDWRVCLAQFSVINRVKSLAMSA
jgi:hypothetical protein